jgi:hypothetical protein
MNTYKRHRFPPDIISFVVWLYYRFNLSHRDIEDLFAERDISMENMDHAFNMGIPYNGGSGVIPNWLGGTVVAGEPHARAGKFFAQPPYESLGVERGPGASSQQLWPVA